jgi:hypothetical protein
MSTESGSPQEQPTPATPMVICRVCETEVPAGAFCGFCGAHLFAQPGTGPDWLRLRAYAAAAGEHVLRLSAVSTLFPHLPHRSRAAFRVGMAGLAVVLLVLALLRWQAPLVGVSALGFPLLFQLYLQECDVFDDLPVRLLAVVAVLGAAIGVGWALLTGPIVARSFAVAIGVGPAVTAERLLRDGLAVPLCGALLMQVPAVVVRLVRPPIRESLDGFLIGSLGAVSYIAAATLTRLVPQLATGVMTTNRSVGGLVVEAGIRGVASPLTAAAAGGIVGAALWVTRRVNGQYRGRPLTAVLPAVGVVLAIYAVLGLIDVAPLAPWLLLILDLLVAAGAILALRIAVHISLLHEEHDLLQGPPLLCPECHHVVSDMAFCPNCGAATRASPRSSRKARRASPPVPTDTTSENR